MAYRKFNCACGCGELVQLDGQFVRGHRGPVMQQRRETAEAEQQITITKLEKLLAQPKKPEEPEAEPAAPVEIVIAPALEPTIPAAPDPVVSAGLRSGPPVAAASIDRRRWRLASERPSTPRDNPWIETKCHSCLLPMWTRDPLSTWEHGGLCEEDDYILRVELGTHGRQQFQHQARTYHDPFRPR